MKETLILLTRYPEPGTTKTRLIPALGSEGAAELQRAMTMFIVSSAKQAAKNNGLSIEVHHEGGSTEQMSSWLGSDLTYVRQSDGDIGERMAGAVGSAHTGKCKKILVAGSDCPELSADDIMSALEYLDHSDIVIAPATDGGYCLIGMNSNVIDRTIPALFYGIRWSTEHVLTETVAAAERAGLRCGFIRTLTDIDKPGDLPVWHKSQKKLSIIIPTLNEEMSIQKTIEAVSSGKNIEIIVADCGSSDSTAAIAENAGATVITAERGRAQQMNAGAQAASGELFLFLHADTILPRGYDTVVRTALIDTSISLGAFSFRTDSKRAGIRIVEGLANFRSNFMKTPYGDQAFFVSAENFHNADGFPLMPIMEDFEFARIMRKRGRVVTVKEEAITSSRRWHTVGLVRTTLINQLVIAGYYFGVSPSRLHTLYHKLK